MVMMRLSLINFIMVGVNSDPLHRESRDLVLENMVMRTKKFSPQDRDSSPLVGGGILERKIIDARNGTAGKLYHI